MNTKDIEVFVADYETMFKTGKATELSYRSIFETLFKKDTGIIPVNDPKTVNHNRPDFTFLRETNNDFIVGYAEMKDVGVDLDEIEQTNQWERYKELDNIFLTDGFEWRFYKNGTEYTRITIVIFDSVTKTLSPCPEYYEALSNQLNYFFESSTETVTSGRRLAEIMGNRARVIRDKILGNVEDERILNAAINGVYDLFKSMLVEELKIDAFADMYAQTLVYGLFIARYNDPTPDSFSRIEARELIPNTNPLLRVFFDHIAGVSFDPNLQPIIDSLCQILCVCDVKKVVSKHVNTDEMDYRDPIIHFYEDFLESYDPALKKKMGAYYTPTPVVKYIIKAVDKSLIEDFKIRGGISSNETTTFTRHVDEGYKKGKGTGSKVYYDEEITIPKIQILDPAVGTATFLNETIRYIYKQKFANQQGIWSDYVNKNLIKRLNGFEIMMTPYTIAHLKLGMTLQSLDADLPDDRLRIFLTNTLTLGIKNDLPMYQLVGLANAVTVESEMAAEVKNDYPVMVIIGNPPYSGESSNNGKYAKKIINKYKFEPGGTEKLNERNPKWLNDDYVKFIAFSEDMIVKNGQGIMAMITNHKYLVNPTFRGMRWHLLSSFDKIYIIDLHGHTEDNESSPTGDTDENVFDNIKQGVSIIVAIKTSSKKELASLYHAEIIGTRKNKFSKLKNNDISFSKVELDKIMYYFVPRNNEGIDDYNSCIPINELMPVNSVAIVTGNNDVLIDENRDALYSKIQQFKENGKGKIHDRLKKANLSKDYIVPISKRVFDKQYIYYDSKVVERDRRQVMKHILPDKNGLASIRNYAMIFKRGLCGKTVPPIFVSDSISESRYWSCSGMEGIDYSAPLYIKKDATYVPNFDKTRLAMLFSELNPSETDNITTEKTFFYIYAVLHSNNFFEKYSEFLKTDFPRVPKPQNLETFTKLSELGEALVNLHLMKDSIETNVSFPQKGNCIVDSLEYKENKVKINKTQYFDNVPEQAWNAFIGGYQPARQWLSDRKGKKLSFDDVEHYGQIIAVLIESNRIIDEINMI